MDNNKVTEILGFVLETLKSTKEFTLEQAPIVAQELLTYGLLESILTPLYLLMVAFVAWKACNFSEKKGEQSGNSEGRWFAGMILGGILFIFFGVGFFISVGVCGSNIIKIKTAPRLYLIQEVQEMINEKK